MFCVYILYSEKLSKYYIGTTDDVNRRLSEHNSMKYGEAFTVKGIPWNLYFQIECESSLQAYRLEQFIKQMKSVKFVQKLIIDKVLVASLLLKFK